MIASFAEHYWQRALLVTALSEGVASTRWQAQITLLSDLAALCTTCDDRQTQWQQAQRLPQLFEQIQAGLAGCSYNAFDCAEMLASLHKTLTDRLQGITPSQEYSARELTQSSSSSGQY